MLRCVSELVVCPAVTSCVEGCPTQRRQADGETWSKTGSVSFQLFKMSASIVAAPDSSLNVRYTRKVQENRGDGEENQVEILEDEEHHADLGSQKASKSEKDYFKIRY